MSLGHNNWRLGLLFLGFLTVTNNGLVFGQEYSPPPGPVCKGNFVDHKEPSSIELKQILHDHADWLASEPRDMNDSRRANLCEADLDGANLAGVNLAEALLHRATLWDAILIGANLSKVEFYGAELHRADLTNANLTFANLTKSDLSQANLAGANLTDADLSAADLEAARLDRSILTRASFAPALLPSPDAFIGVRGLSDIITNGTNLPAPLQPSVEMRKAFREAGFRSHANSMTSAMRKYELLGAGSTETFFQNYVAGGKLTDFGANPWGALSWLGITIPLFFFPYYIALRMRRQGHGIWRCRPGDRILQSDGECERGLLPSGRLQALPWALYFSFLSAFHFGWRQLNLGNWMVRLQGREYTLEATGWVRTTAGIQSLFSLYVVALFLLTYFGEPFA